MCSCGAPFAIDCDCRPDYGYIPASMDPRADPDPYDPADYAIDDITPVLFPADPVVESASASCSCGKEDVCDDCLPF